MLRLSRILLVLLLALAAVRQARAEPVATLVTVGPGDAVWEKFGHNMIRIQGLPIPEIPQLGDDYCYNWGLFDFEKPNFIGNFVHGRMLYTMSPIPTAPLLREYESQNRRVRFQTLRLSPEQLRELYIACLRNFARNPDYRYDYFKDNCSTRVRDMLDGVTGGAFARAMKGKPAAPGVTYRSETMRLMQGGVLTPDFWVSLGTDFAMGPATDKPLDRWAEGFLPEAVSETAKAFADAPTEPWSVTRPLPAMSPPTRWPGLFAAGLAVAAGVWFAKGVSRKILVAVWWLASGFGGLFLLYFWLFTDHSATYANQNLWHYSPIAWLALLAAMIRRLRLAAKLAVSIAWLSVVGGIVWLVGGLGGPFAQANGGFILLALPINLAIAYAARPLTVKAALTKPDAAADMAE